VSDLKEFILARVAEDELVARQRPSYAQIHSSGCYYYDYTLDAGWFCDCDEDGAGSRRLLAECDVKRRIVAELPAGTVLELLARPYSDHPDFDPAWSGPTRGSEGSSDD
jgi:hypothetical protein